MKFSILIPVYNVEQYLEECLQTVFHQTYDNYEVIIVDDGSTDRSGIICDQFMENNPEKCRVIHKQNQGLLAARREGIAAATGEFCVFVDSDDYVELNLLETIENYLKTDEQIDVLLYSFQYVRNGKVAERYHVVWEDGSKWEGESKKEVYEKLACTSYIASIWTKAIRTSILKEDSTNYEQYFGKDMSEDILQSIYPITAARKIMYTDKVLYNYRINDESISRSFYPATLQKKNTLHVYGEIVSRLSEWGLNNREINDKLKARWFNDFMYMMSKYYESAQRKEDRQAIIAFDWKSMLPENAYDPENPYENENYKKLYRWLEEKNIHAISIYFARKRCYQKLKKWKKVLRAWGKRKN